MLTVVVSMVSVTELVTAGVVSIDTTFSKFPPDVLETDCCTDCAGINDRVSSSEATDCHIDRARRIARGDSDGFTIIEGDRHIRIAVALSTDAVYTSRSHRLQ